MSWKAIKSTKVSTDKFGVGDSTTPVVTQAHIADPTGGATTDTEARAAIASILNVLEAFGLTATS